MKINLKHNFLIKIISVCIAIVLWFYIQIVQNPEINFTYSNMKVSLVNSSILQERNLIIVGETDFRTDVTVNCPRWNLNELDKEDFVAYVDLSEVKGSGITELPIKIRMNNENIIVANKSPATVSVEVDKIVTVEKDLKVYSAGKLPEDYYTSMSLIVPEIDKISVEGPQSVVSKISNGIITVNLDNKKESFENAYKVVLVDSEGTAIADERITVFSGSVNVKVDVFPKKIVPITVTGIPEEIKYIVTPKDIEVAGPRELIENMTEYVVNDFTLDDTSVGYTQKIDVVLDENLIKISDVVPYVKITE